MEDKHIINQPLVEVTVFQCPICFCIIKNRSTKLPYGCPFGCPCQLHVLRIEYEEGV